MRAARIPLWLKVTYTSGCSGLGENSIQTWMAPGWYFALQLAFWPLVIYLPTQWAFKKWMPQRAAGRDENAAGVI